VIGQAIEALHQYLQRKVRQVREAERLLSGLGDLNHRQVALMRHALRRDDAQYTIQSHRRSHGVAYQTARTDLLNLESRGLLARRRRGNAYVFEPPADLASKLGRGREMDVVE